MTSIGSAVLLLAQKLKRKDCRNCRHYKQCVEWDCLKSPDECDHYSPEKPQAVIVVTDLGENTPPYLKNTLPLLKEHGTPPLIILFCGTRHMLRIDYPHAVIPVEDFHSRLLGDVIAQIARLTAKVAVEEKEVTEVVRERKVIDEELGAVQLPERPPESLKPGYLERVLCSG